MENLKRVHWKSKLGFLLAAIGSAVGLGNIWRFPYVAYKNGGGAFLIPYLIALLLVGIPLLVLEHGLGQLKKGSAPLAFGKIRRGWEYLGWWVSVFICFGLMLYYSAVLSWCVHYFGFSFSGAWGENTQAFFFQDFLQLSESPFDIGSINWSIFAGIAVVWFVNWLVISRGIRKGIEIANKIGMPLLFATLLLLLVWSLLLPGASTGVAALVVPNLSKLLSPSVWHDAFGQIFFTLSLGSGVMIVFASYLPDRKNLTGNAIKTAAANSTVELIAGFAVFAIIGYIATNAGKPIDQAVQSGPGLAFVVYPQAISHLPFGNVPFGNVLFGALFFFTLLLAGLTSSISIIETFISAAIDKFNWKRKPLVTVVCLVGFAGSAIFATNAGLYWLDIIDHMLTNMGLLLVGFFEIILVAWIFGAKRFIALIDRESNLKLGKFWIVTAKYITPLVLIALFVISARQDFITPYGGYPWEAIIVIGFGWLAATLIVAKAFSEAKWKTDHLEQEDTSEALIVEVME